LVELMELVVVAGACFRFIVFVVVDAEDASRVVGLAS
jgi:hypothetical protein